ncbi:MAG TPA: YeeE/YedE thiosulfate transporter family protein, partial [Minicystis sp.]|nr:YeeE/YedE thiosulfate transporter family protein [Minicystis sp.]
RRQANDLLRLPRRRAGGHAWRPRRRLSAMPPTYLAANATGGGVFGVGMALAGFCPGTVAVGEGRLDDLVPGALGLHAGAVVDGLADDRVRPWIARLAALGPVGLADLLRVEPWLVVALFVELAALGFYAATHARPARLISARRARARRRGPCRTASGARAR